MKQQRERGRGRARKWGQQHVRDVATCHHFSPLLLEMHHQSLGGSMTRRIITHTDTQIHLDAHTGPDTMRILRSNAAAYNLSSLWHFAELLKPPASNAVMDPSIITPCRRQESCIVR